MITLREELTGYLQLLLLTAIAVRFNGECVFYFLSLSLAVIISFVG